MTTPEQELERVKGNVLQDKGFVISKNGSMVLLQHALNAVKQTRQETFKISSGVLKDIIERIRQQNDIYWDTGNEDKTAYVIPKSMVKQFEIMLEAMQERMK